LRRFLRVEKRLCQHAVAHISPTDIIAWRDRRLTELPSRGQANGRGQYRSEVEPKGRHRADGTDLIPENWTV
jgi:hypothetical protein